ncbi:hypothetical protein [Kitasatospora phosalacinea]|uniref:Uncharacterized protein n=1 Tax=Kitasatospora phosalacinea TaxID=2065 RepID=A0A9W6PNF0_9ACTN|nr:hypothetical protein [Kitasatospora phosalacinea]GLW57991.1 hypothetical protein Kpho01_60020 [Kitasatospora phosalacinea]
MPTPAPQPEVVLGHHPDHGVVAALPTRSAAAAAAWMLERLEFQRIADHPHLYAFTEQHRDAPDRLRWAVKVLNGAGYAVHSDLSLDAHSEPQVGLPRQVAAHRTPAATTARGFRTDEAALLRSPAARRGPATAAAPPSPPPGAADPRAAFARTR